MATPRILFWAILELLRASRSEAFDGIRINKVLTGSHSRRESDRLIASGRVRINGQLAIPGDRVKPGDNITLDGKPVLHASAFVAAGGTAPNAHDDFVYLKYWKPRGVTCTTDRKIPGNLIDALRFSGPERLFPVGRLDKDSEGLILLTSDGRLVNSVSRARFAKEKLYEVKCNRLVSDAHLRQMALGVVITTIAQRDGQKKELTAPTLPCDVSRTGPKSFNIVLTEGRNRQIRRMCEAVGAYKVVRLHRASVMGIDLQGLQSPGQWTHLKDKDLEVVKRAINAGELSPTQPPVSRPQAPQAPHAPPAPPVRHTSSDIADEIDVKSLNKGALQRRLKSLGLKVSGNKEELVARLQLQQPPPAPPPASPVRHAARDIADEIDLKSLSKVALQSRLKSLGLKVSGNKAELVARLQPFG